MIATHELKKRDMYLDRLIAFQDTEPIKVVTGIRRCGKSSLLKVADNQAKRIVLNLDDYPGQIEDIITELNNYPVDGLKEVIAVQNGKVFNIF